MLQLYLREYTVPGQLVDASTSGGQPGQHQATISAGITCLSSQNREAELELCFGVLDDGVPRVRFSQHTASQISEGINQGTKTANIAPGKLIRTNTDSPEILADWFHIVVEPIELPDRPPGLTVTIGEDEYEGATLEFTPAQATDLLDLFELFTNKPIEDELSNPLLAPSHVDATGTLEDL